MSVFAASAFDNHERVVFVHDKPTGLRAIIALHRIVGQSSGGIRMKCYADEAAALHDVLRLSRAMTLKWVCAGFKIGGGKMVVIGDPEHDKTPDMLRAIGCVIDELGGVYIAGSDVGTNPDDLRIIAETTQHVRGVFATDGAEATAYGVMQAMRAAARFRLGRDDLMGVRVAVQGVGNVGSALCRMLTAQGAILKVADLSRARAEAVGSSLGAECCDVETILYEDVDIVAPCALGGVVSSQNVSRLEARIVCGAANNQLMDDDAGRLLFERGILFTPDYAASAGGIINGQAEGPDYDRAKVWDELDRIYDRCMKIFETSAAKNVPPDQAAEMFAAEQMLRYV